VIEYEEGQRVRASVEEHFTSTKYGDDKQAMQARNKRARELRKQGFAVTCKTWDFTDLARARDYTLKARRD
jgi:hypothetical protein